MVRLVLDTNVLVNADRGEGSHGKRILDLVRWGEVEAVISEPVKREKQLIVGRLVKDRALQEGVKEYFGKAHMVEPVEVMVPIEDEEDMKLVELAVGGQAQFLVTDDRHLLDLGQLGSCRIVKPAEFWQWWEAQQDGNGSTWASWAKQTLGQ